MASTAHKNMRIWHRYLGFFLAGIMAVYAISGVVLIFRNTNFLKREEQIQKQLQPGLTAEALGKEIKLRDLKFSADSSTAVRTFEQGTYNVATGAVEYKIKSLPVVLDKLTKLHKANTASPLFFLNIFFGASLLFFVLSSFWMFLPGSSIFRKGMYFTLAGVLLTVLLLFF